MRKIQRVDPATLTLYGVLYDTVHTVEFSTLCEMEKYENPLLCAKRKIPKNIGPLSPEIGWDFGSLR